MRYNKGEKQQVTLPNTAIKLWNPLKINSITSFFKRDKTTVKYNILEQSMSTLRALTLFLASSKTEL